MEAKCHILTQFQNKDIKMNYTATVKSNRA